MFYLQETRASNSKDIFELWKDNFQFILHGIFPVASTSAYAKPARSASVRRATSGKVRLCQAAVVPNLSAKPTALATRLWASLPYNDIALLFLETRLPGTVVAAPVFFGL